MRHLLPRFFSLSILVLAAAACGDDASGDPVLPDTGPILQDAGPMPSDGGGDADGNGIPDSREGDGDADGDGMPDAVDRDDDNDRVSDVEELGDRIEFPSDSDDDGVPNFRDPDSDEDGILDGDEWGHDVDGDGLDDGFDRDADGDGIPDMVEAGDSDLRTPPVDTDEDLVADFRDPDSDDDGLTDANERESGSSPTNADTDGDGVGDLIEVGAGTDPRDAAVSPRTRGDFVFVMPYLEPAMPERDTLRFRTNIQFADVYFQFDTTGSMIAEIAPMKAAIVEVIENITCVDTGTPCTGDPECPAAHVCSASGTCISDPRESGCIASLWTGVGVFAGATDTYRNLLALQPDPTETQRRIPDAATGTGASEALFESIACVADPSVCSGAECVPGGIGCPAFRADAVRILVTITDEDNQCTTCSANTALDAGMRLRDRNIVFVGVDADASSSPEEDLKAVGTAAGSVDASGQPIYVNGDGPAVTSAVTDAIREIAHNVPIFVDIGAEEVAGDDGDALQFIDRLEIHSAGEPECSDVRGTADTDGDGFHDAFPSLLPGTPVCWDVVARENDRVMPGDRPQVFRARVVVRGDGSVLDARNVYFLVPPRVDLPILM